MRRVRFWSSGKCLFMGCCSEKPWRVTAMDREKHGSDDNLPDLSRLIQSIQRIEGNPDCFGTAGGYCDRLDCQWRGYCLKEPENRLNTEGSEKRNKSAE
jgi:hypothetical protein